MKRNILKFCTLLLFVLGVNGLQAQEAITASGGNAIGSGGSVSYSVGQVSYKTITGNNGSVNQGVQQPYEISVVSGITQAKLINIKCIAYPNPTTNQLTLSIDNFELENLSYKLYDMSGRLLQTKKINSNNTSINMSKLLHASYFVKVLKDNTEVKTFKIIKN
jgi:hypothetical protein